MSLPESITPEPKAQHTPDKWLAEDLKGQNCVWCYPGHPATQKVYSYSWKCSMRVCDEHAQAIEAENKRI
jgi:hypothetical protein